MSLWSALGWLWHIEFEILDKDIYNMDEKGFLMGLAHAVKVLVQCARKKEERHLRQAGNQELVTVIEGVGSTGYSLPPLIVFKGKRLMNEWYNHMDSLPWGMYNIWNQYMF